MKTTSLLLALSATLAFAQGPLTPPGAPAPTMKTLDQIEPRIDVLKLPGDATAMRVISAPGSYLLTANLIADSGKSGIRIDANNVTLDLMGFLISGSTTNDAAGVRLNEALRDISITNGSITGFVSMISGETTLKRITVSHVKGSGSIFVLGDNSVVEHCVATDYVSASRVHHCSAGSIAARIVSYSIAIRDSGGPPAVGISVTDSGGIVDNCVAWGKVGIYCNGNVTNSSGSGSAPGGDGGIGIQATGNVSNSTGTGMASFAGLGYGILSDGNVTNSTGNARAYLDPAANGGSGNPLRYAVPGIAIKAKVISYSNAVGINYEIALAVRLECNIAIGCTSSGNDLITHKYLMP